MSAIRVLHENLRAQFDDVFGLVQVDDARVASSQSVAQAILGTADDRRDFPERIVEIQCDRTYAEHGLPTLSQ
jgi:hypothetical protein